MPNVLVLDLETDTTMRLAKQKAGAELFKDLKLSRAVLKSVISNITLPISIKVRTKAGQVDILQFLDYVSDLDIKAIMIHGRSLKQGFNGPVDYKIIREARKHFKGIILANGGVQDKKTAQELLKETGADGIGIARGALGKPWVFRNVKSPQPPLSRGNKEIFRIALRHAELAYKLKGEVGIREMGKH